MAFYPNAPLPDVNARQVAQTIRMPSTALLTIDSEDRYTDYTQARGQAISPYNFTITKSESLMPGFMTRIGISEVVFPWVIPNINPKTKEISITAVNGATINTEIIVIPEGFTSPNNLSTALQTEINTYLTSLGFGDSISVLYGISDIPNFQFRVTSGGTLNSFAIQPLAYNSEDYPYPPTTKQLYDLIGLGAGGTLIMTPGTTYYGSSTLCQAIRYIDIVCNQLTNSQAQKDQTSQVVARDMLCRLYIGDGGAGGQSTIPPSYEPDPNVLPGFSPPGCAPFVIYRNFATPKQIQWIPNQNIPGFLQFQVYDDSGQLLDESVVVDKTGVVKGYSSTDWSMTMLVSEN
jgi:hypothetical protein